MGLQLTDILELMKHIGLQQKTKVNLIQAKKTCHNLIKENRKSE